LGFCDEPNGIYILSHNEGVTEAEKSAVATLVFVVMQSLL